MSLLLNFTKNFKENFQQTSTIKSLTLIDIKLMQIFLENF